MNIKQVVIVGTMACVITIVPAISGQTPGKAYAANPTKITNQNDSKDSGADRLNETLGLSTDKALYDALLDGQSLVDIAALNQKDIDPVIMLQTEQLQQQLTRRFDAGQLSEVSYKKLMEEAAEIIKASAHQSYHIFE